MTYIRRLVKFIIWNWPFGYVCQFPYGAGSVGLTKNLWVVSFDDVSSDALPLNYVRQELVDKFEQELAKKWWNKP